MTSRTRPRHVVLGALLVVTLGLTVWTHHRKNSADVGDVSEPVARRGQAGLAGEGVAKAEPPKPMPQADESNGLEPTDDPFFVTQWEPPPPPPPPPPTPPPPPQPVTPVAPPLPFQYVGRHELADGPAEETQFFLSQGDATVTVRKGEAIGSEYRFDGVDGQGNLQFVYLPLGTKQLLSIGAQP